MLVPRVFWRRVGAASGRVAPGPMRAYYRAVARSYVSVLRQTEGVRALYVYGSFVGGNFRPGRSDVDFVAVTETPTPESEVDLLRRLRGPYRRHQGLLPIDVWELPDSELEDTASWIGAMRPRAGEDRPRRSVKEWELVAGEEVRTGRVWVPDPRLATTGDYFIGEAIRWAASGPRSAFRLGSYLTELERDVGREGFDWPAVQDLRRSRARLARGSSDPRVMEAAIHAALRVVEAHRRHHAFPYSERLTPEDDWRVSSPGDEAVGNARRLLRTLDREAAEALRSATIFLPLRLEETPATLLLECKDSRAAQPVLAWMVRGGGAALARRGGLSLHLLTSWLVEDAWRNARNCYALAGGGRCLLGEELRGRIRLPERRWRQELSHYEGFWAATRLRWRILGHRSTKRGDGWPLHLAAERGLAAGGAPLLEPRALMREVPELRALGSDDPKILTTLDDAALARVGLEIWRGWPPVPGRS